MNCSLKNSSNKTDGGGAIHFYATKYYNPKQINIINSRFENCSAVGNGGAIYSELYLDTPNSN